MNTIKNNKLLLLDYVAFAIIVIAFFAISYCGFYFSDDITMAYGGVPTGFGERFQFMMFLNLHGGGIFVGQDAFFRRLLYIFSVGC